jgi:hypothetical protein
MVGDYPPDPLNVDLTSFHSLEVPKGTGMNYADGITPFILAKVRLAGGDSTYVIETGYRERQESSPYSSRIMRFEPRPGFFQVDTTINHNRSFALSDKPETWPPVWPDKMNDSTSPGWPGAWNGFFGKNVFRANQESYAVMDDNYYDKWRTVFRADSSDSTRYGLGLRIGVRSFQWTAPSLRNTIFWHYDILNEGTTHYDSLIFGLYVDAGVGSPMIGCDGLFETEDDNATWTRSPELNLAYMWDYYGHGKDLLSNCSPTGYMGYSFLETPNQMGLTGFQMIYISQGIDDVVFFMRPPKFWPQRLYNTWTSPNFNSHFDPRIGSNNINIAYLIPSGPFALRAGQTAQFRLALSYGDSLSNLQTNTRYARMFYESNYTNIPPLSVDDDPEFTPQNAKLFDCFPNPFNPSTTIRFQIPHPSFVSLQVYNLLGQEIATLIAEEKLAGDYKAEWNPQQIASGMYFYRLTAGDFVETKKMLLVR